MCEVAEGEVVRDHHPRREICGQVNIQPQPRIQRQSALTSLLPTSADGLEQAGLLADSIGAEEVAAGAGNARWDAMGACEQERRNANGTWKIVGIEEGERPGYSRVRIDCGRLIKSEAQNTVVRTTFLYRWASRPSAQEGGVCTPYICESQTTLNQPNERTSDRKFQQYQTIRWNRMRYSA